MRCFIAAWPDARTRIRLADIGRELRTTNADSTAMRAENLHLTLAFIGELAETELKAASQICRNLRFEPFIWSINALGSFASARVAWAGGEASQRLLQLATEARSELDKVAIRYDPQPFVPHVTLLRNVRNFKSSGALSQAVEWRIDDVDLFGSVANERGVQYRRVAI